MFLKQLKSIFYTHFDKIPISLSRGYTPKDIKDTTTRQLKTIRDKRRQNDRYIIINIDLKQLTDDHLEGKFVDKLRQPKRLEKYDISTIEE